MAQKKDWLYRLDEIISRHLGDPLFSNKSLANTLGISERQLFRKVRQATGMSPHKYIRKQRLHAARKYLQSGKCSTVNEASAVVGYVNTSYFISQFQREFGTRPFKILQEARYLGICSN